MMHLVKAVVTTLSMERAPAGPDASWPAGCETAWIVPEPRMPLARYRALYDAVGRDHHWTSRILPDDRLAAEIHAAEIALYTLSLDGRTAGWFEIETFLDKRRARIVHFAVMPAFRRRHLAGPMLDRAIRLAFAPGVETLIIETNTLDHPAALALYRAHGFRTIQERDVLTPPIEAYDAQR